jgi:hypothetical protein
MSVSGENYEPRTQAMRIIIWVGGWLLVSTSVSLAQTTVSLASTGAANSVLVDYFSDGFGRPNLTPNGFWQLSNSSLPNEPRNTMPQNFFGQGFATHPNGVNFQLGTLTHTTGTGSGTETLSVTAVNLNLLPDMDPRFDYTTAVSNVSGTVTRTNGTLTSINLTANVAFTFTESIVNGLVYDGGTFSIAGNQFDLVVDDTNLLFGMPARFVWDADGTVNAVTPIPEPLSGLAFSGTTLVVWYSWRRRGV